MQNPFNSTHIPNSFSIHTPRSAREIVHSTSTHHSVDISVEEIFAATDVSEIINKVSKNNNEKQLKNLTLSMVRRYKDEQNEAQNKKTLLENALQDTQSQMNVLKERLGSATRETNQAREESKKA